MVQQQQTDDIDAFIQSLREKALERQRRSSRVESSVQESTRRIAEQQRLFSRLAEAPDGLPPAFHLSTPAPPAQKSPRDTARQARAQSARSNLSLVEELSVEPAPTFISPAAPETEPTPFASEEAQPFAPVNIVPVAEYMEMAEPAPRRTDFYAETESFLEEPAISPAVPPVRRMPDLSAMGVSWEPASPVSGPHNAEFESETNLASEAVEPADEPARFGFLRSHAGAHVFEPHAPQPLAVEEAEQESAPPQAVNSAIRPIAPLPLKKQAAVAKPLEPAKPAVVKLPFLDEGADPQIQMIATAVQAAAKEHHSRPTAADRPLPKFATMSAYDDEAEHQTIECEEQAPAKIKVTLTRAKKRSLWPFGSKAA